MIWDLPNQHIFLYGAVTLCLIVKCNNQAECYFPPVSCENCTDSVVIRNLVRIFVKNLLILGFFHFRRIKKSTKIKKYILSLIYM